MRVAIIGGGVVGICMLRELSSIPGVDCILFDAQSRVGGVWNNTGSVPYMSLQISSRHYRFPDYPHNTDIDRPDAAYVQRYIEDYVEKKGLRSFVRCNTPVEKVKEVENGCMLFFRNATEKYDIVICTGTASIPNIPDMYLPHSLLIHTSQLDQRTLVHMANKTCCVIGGSKSAAEAVCALYRAKAEVVWVARKFYTYGRFVSRTSVGVWSAIRCFGSFLFSSNRDCLFDLKIHGSDQINGGTGNLLVDDELDILRSVQTYKGNVKKVGPRNIVLDDGTVIDCNVLVLGTGYIENRCGLVANVQKDQHSSSTRIFSCIDYPGLMTSFGIINGHITASIFRSYLSTAWPDQPFSQYWETYIRKQKIALTLYQIHYLITSGSLPRLCQYNDYLTKRIYVTIAFILCLGLVLALLKHTHS